MLRDQITKAIAQEPSQISTQLERLESMTLSPEHDIDTSTTFPLEAEEPPLPKATTLLVIHKLFPSICIESLRRTLGHKALGLYRVPGVLLKHMSQVFLTALYNIFRAMAITCVTPPAWFQSHTALFDKKSDPLPFTHYPLDLTNYRPITLANLIYKLWFSCLTFVAVDNVESQNIIRLEQEGFRSDRSCSRAIIHLGHSIEDVHVYHPDILICYLYFEGALPSTNQTQLTRVLYFFGLPDDFILIVSNIYLPLCIDMLTHYSWNHITDSGTLRNTSERSPIPLLFSIMARTLILSLATQRNGYNFVSIGLLLASEWYADDTTLFVSNPEDVMHLLSRVEAISH